MDPFRQDAVSSLSQEVSAMQWRTGRLQKSYTASSYIYADRAFSSVHKEAYLPYTWTYACSIPVVEMVMPPECKICTNSLVCTPQRRRSGSVNNRRELVIFVQHVSPHRSATVGLLWQHLCSAILSRKYQQSLITSNIHMVHDGWQSHTVHGVPKLIKGLGV